MKLSRHRARQVTSIIGSRESIQYFLRDDFSDTRSAGSVNGTLATDGVNTRTVVDTGNKLSIGSGLLTITSHTVAASDPRLIYSEYLSRVAGLILLMKNKLPSLTHFGFGTGSENYPTKSAIAGVGVYNTIAIYDNGNVNGVIGRTANVDYQWAIILRASGAQYFIKGHTDFPYWTLLWTGEADPSTPLKVQMAQRDSGCNFDYFHVYKNRFWLPSPLVSDGFGGANGSSDGAGHAEGVTGGLGTGGSSIAWTDRLGVWGNTGGVRNASSLDGSGIAICTSPSGKADVNILVKLTRTSGNMGVVFRYVDASNYAYAYILNDGANKLTLRQVVGGVDSELIAPTAITYSAATIMRIHVVGTKVRVFYGMGIIGTEQTLNAALTGTTHGLYSTNTGNTFNDYQVWARGTGGEYESSFSLTPSSATYKTVSVPDGADLTSYISQLAPGDTLELAVNGNYTLPDLSQGFTAIPSGYLSKYTVINGNGSTITGGQDGLYFYGRAYININNLNWVNQTRYTITYDYCHHVFQSGCTYKSTLGNDFVDVLKIFRSDDLGFTSCRVKATTGLATCDGFEFWGPCQRVRVIDCIVDGITGSLSPDHHGYEVYAGASTDICNDILFSGCSASNCDVGYSIEGGTSNVAHINMRAVDCTTTNCIIDAQGIQSSTLNVTANTLLNRNGTVIEI